MIVIDFLFQLVFGYEWGILVLPLMLLLLKSLSVLFDSPMDSNVNSKKYQFLSFSITMLIFGAVWILVFTVHSELIVKIKEKYPAFNVSSNYSSFVLVPKEEKEIVISIKNKTDDSKKVSSRVININDKKALVFDCNGLELIKCSDELLKLNVEL